MHVVIIGAGLGGIAMAIELRRHGFTDVTVLERAPEVGGTWFYNSYPGAACDVPSHLYSYSYEQRRDWSRLCSPQSEILAYLQGVADEYRIAEMIQTGRRVTECRFDDVNEVWQVETESGDHYEADAIV